jgi:hypothetical protein
MDERFDPHEPDEQDEPLDAQERSDMWAFHQRLGQILGKPHPSFWQQLESTRLKFDDQPMTIKQALQQTCLNLLMAFDECARAGLLPEPREQYAVVRRYLLEMAANPSPQQLRVYSTLVSDPNQPQTLDLEG